MTTLQAMGDLRYALPYGPSSFSACPECRNRGREGWARGGLVCPDCAERQLAEACGDPALAKKYREALERLREVACELEGLDDTKAASQT